MKECVECRKKLGIIEGYRHPIMGKDHLLCSSCFDTISASVNKYMEFISPYVGFFNKQTSTIDDIQKIGENIKKMQNKIDNFRTHETNQNGNEILFTIH